MVGPFCVVRKRLGDAFPPLHRDMNFPIAREAGSKKEPAWFRKFLEAGSGNGRSGNDRVQEKPVQETARFRQRPFRKQTWFWKRRFGKPGGSGNARSRNRMVQETPSPRATSPLLPRGPSRALSRAPSPRASPRAPWRLRMMVPMPSGKAPCLGLCLGSLGNPKKTLNP